LFRADWKGEAEKASGFRAVQTIKFGTMVIVRE